MAFPPAAEQSGAELRARVGHRSDDPREDAGVDLRGREVVEKEHRLGAHRERVVDAVMHEVGADDLVTIEEPREVELRPDAVRRRDEDLVTAGRGEEPAELTDVADDLRAPGARDTVFHPGKRILGTRDVHAGVPVCEAHAFTGSASSESFASSSCTGTR